MSERYPGARISATPPVPSGPYNISTASGVWSLDQQLQYQQQGIWPTAGLTPNYIEDVFSTWLYTGNNSGGATPTQTITNSIDLSGKGGMTLLQCRSNDTGTAWNVYDTARGVRNYLRSNSTAAQSTASSGSGLTTFNSNGFTLGTTSNTENFNGYTYASWTFRKQPKFFDIVTFTGDGTDGRAISHSLGSVPGCIIMRKTSAVDDWYVYHRNGNDGTQTGLGLLNSSAAFDLTANTFGGPGAVPVFPTSTTFTIRNSINATGATYIAYIFAHNAGGFGLTGTDNVISCGSYTGNGGAGNTITLGYEPQWLLVKCSTNINQKWVLLDNMRGLPVNSQNEAVLFANTTAAESTAFTGSTSVSLTATGFILDGGATELNSKIGRAHV